MDICCICKSKNIPVKNTYFLFTDKNGNKRIICDVCREYINNAGNVFGENNYRESISYFRNLCDTRKLKATEVINYLNENVLMFEENKLTVGETDVYDRVTVAVKVIKWVITVGIALAGLIVGIVVVLSLWSTNDAFIGFLIGTGIFMFAGLITFSFYSIIKVVEDWLFYRGLTKR